MKAVMSQPDPIVVLSSGGKDSMLMLDRVRSDPAWDVQALVTTVNETNRRVAMHGTPASLIQQQADSLGWPLKIIGLPEDCDNAEYERRLEAGLRPFLDRRIGHVACGDLFLSDIRQWREALFERLGWHPVFPLWHQPTEGLVEVLAGADWSLTVTCVDLEALSEHFLGRQFDAQFLSDLPAGVDPCGEYGEFHTFVSDGPGFSRPIPFRTGRIVVTHGRFAMLELLES